MVSLKSLIFGKSVIVIDSLTEETREGVQKAYIPKWLFKPSYGYPRYANMSLIRWLAKTPYAEMCLVPGTKIYLGTGDTKDIEDISIGDFVLTHTGKKKRVTELFKREVNEELYIIKTYMCNKEIKITHNHPLLVKRDNISKPQWVNADKLKLSDYILFPKDKYIDDITYINLEENINYVEPILRRNEQGQFKKNHFGSQSPKIGDITLNDPFLRIIGSYLAEGCCDRRCVVFGFGSQEEEIALQIVKDVKHIFGIDAKIQYKDSVIIVRVHHANLTRFFKQNFGKTGDLKQLPDWLFYLDSKRLIPLVENYFLGDGFDSFYLIGCDSISNKLILQIRDILLRLNILSSYRKINRDKIVILGRLVNARTIYHLSISGENRIKFKQLIFNEEYNKTSYSKGGKIDEDYAYLKVREIKKEHYIGTVHNFEVEDDNSYCTEYHCVHNCISTIVEEVKSIPWDIVIEPGFEDLYLDKNGDIKPEKQKEIDHIKRFFENPNTNKETFEDVFIEMPVRDILEVNAGILNKVYNLREEMVEIVARDGSSFTRNPDIHGMYTNRKDLIIPKTIVNNPGEVVNEFEHIHATRVREDAAYFQYGWIAGPMPIPFGKKEIIWMEKMKRTDEIYGYSPIQVLANALQMLIWMIDSDLEYFNENNTPKGIIGLDDSDADEIAAFRDQWYNQQRTKDEFGNYKKMMHKVPIVNKTPKFTRIEFSASEMQLIEKQKWYSKMVWACFGCTGVELGYTEDAQGQANQIVQSKVFKKKAINPLLKKLSSHYNMEIVSEFEYEHLQFKFLVFDVEEERIKYELYKLQTESGLKTINECRHKEGDDPLDWGDKPPNEWKQSENSWNVGFDKPMSEREKEAQETDDNIKLPEKREETGKPKEDNPKNENKSLSTGHHPLILSENEKPTGYKRLEKAILYVLRENEEGIKEILKNEMKENSIAGMKDINSVIDKIKSLLSFESLKQITKSLIKNNYLKGWDEAEEQLDMNFMPDSDAIEYLSDYTFGNIKGMNDDIANKLRQELQRGFMEGEGIIDIQERVGKVFDVGEHRAEMIARTEVARSNSTGKLHAYQKAGVKGKKRWLANIDNRTCEVCKRLNGQEVGLDEDFVDSISGFRSKISLAHIQCRCDWIFIADEE